MSSILGMLVGMSFANAAAPLEMRWEEGETHRYVINNQVDLSVAFWMLSETNQERRIMQWATGLNLRCKGIKSSKRSDQVRCDIEDISIGARPNLGDEKGMLEVIQEWDQILTGAALNLVFKRDGSLAEFDLVDLKMKNTNQRSRLVAENMRMMLQRAIVGLEANLPRKGDPSRGAWTGNDLGIMGFATLEGTSGGMNVDTELGEKKGDVYTLKSTFRGVRGPNDVLAPGTDRAANTWEMKGYTEIQFDAGKGVMEAAQWICQGELTPSSILAGKGATFPYVQAIKVQRLDTDQKVEGLGESIVIENTP